MTVPEPLPGEWQPLELAPGVAAAPRPGIFAIDNPTPGELLYHYTTPMAAVSMLASKEMRLGSFADMNDPRESKRWSAGIVGDVEGDRVDDFFELQEQIDSGLRSGVKIAAFTMDRQPDARSPGNHFHRGYGRARMWAQYAANHAGVCLVFDRAQLEENARLIDGGTLRTGPVQYVDIGVGDKNGVFLLPLHELRDLGVEATCRRYLLEHIGPLCFRKNLDWASEEEYRIAFIDDDPAATRWLSLESSLRAVVLGEASYLGFKKGVDQIVRSNWPGVHVGGAVWSGGSPLVLPL